MVARDPPPGPQTGEPVGSAGRACEITEIDFCQRPAVELWVPQPLTGLPELHYHARERGPEHLHPLRALLGAASRRLLSDDDAVDTL